MEKGGEGWGVKRTDYYHHNYIHDCVVGVA